MKFSPLVQELIDSLRCLPGVGAKTAQRMAFHILERNRHGGEKLAHSLALATQNVGHCQQCRNLPKKRYAPFAKAPNVSY